MTEPTLQERLDRWASTGWTWKEEGKVVEDIRQAADALDKAEQRIKELDRERDEYRDAATWERDQRLSMTQNLSKLPTTSGTSEQVTARIAAERDLAEARLVLAERLAEAVEVYLIPTQGFLMDRPSRKYIAPEVLRMWEQAIEDGLAALTAFRESEKKG